MYKINSKITNWPKLTKTEANLIFSLTDNFLFDNLNTFLWKKWDKFESLMKKLKSKWWTEWVEKLVNDIDIALAKMPNLQPWKLWFILRWTFKDYFINNKTWKIFEKWEVYNNKILWFCADKFKDIPSIEKKK